MASFVWHAGCHGGICAGGANRLPTAEAVLSLSNWIFQDEFLDDVYRKHRGRSYEREISFLQMVRLGADALMQHQGSGHQSFVRARKEGEFHCLQFSRAKSRVRCSVTQPCAEWRSGCDIVQQPVVFELKQSRNDQDQSGHLSLPNQDQIVTVNDFTVRHMSQRSCDLVGAAALNTTNFVR
jgi:hypothetical protein